MIPFFSFSYAEGPIYSLAGLFVRYFRIFSIYVIYITNPVLVNADEVNLIGDDIRTIGRNVDVLLNNCRDIGLAVNTGKTSTWK